MPPFRGAPGGTAGGSRGEGCGSPWGTRGRGPAPDEEGEGSKGISSTGMGGGARIVSVRGVSSRGRDSPRGTPWDGPEGVRILPVFSPLDRTCSRGEVVREDLRGGRRIERPTIRIPTRSVGEIRGKNGA